MGIFVALMQTITYHHIFGKTMIRDHVRAVVDQEYYEILKWWLYSEKKIKSSQELPVGVLNLDKL